MIAFIGWLAALVALLTGVAMAKDIQLDAAERNILRAIAVRAWSAWQLGGWRAVRRAEFAFLVRVLLRSTVLVVVVASSGICVLLPFGVGLSSGPYETLLRVGLAAFMAMQTPCPWLRWIAIGQPPAGTTPSGGPGRAH